MKDDLRVFGETLLGLALLNRFFRLRRGDKEWENTVRFILSNHAGYLKGGGLKCDTYEPAFVKLLEEVNQDVCKPKQNPSGSS
jgi:hypothetical protein